MARPRVIQTYPNGMKLLSDGRVLLTSGRIVTAAQATSIMHGHDPTLNQRQGPPAPGHNHPGPYPTKPTANADTRQGPPAPHRTVPGPFPRPRVAPAPRPRQMPAPTTTVHPAAPRARVSTSPPGSRTTASHPGGSTNPSNVYTIPRPPTFNPVPLSAAQTGGSLVPMTDAQTGTPFDMGLAQTYANQEFDPQIQALQNQMAVIPAQTQQDLADIHNWYGQVLGSLGKAKGEVAGNAKNASDSLAAASAGILASLGGANGGSAVVAGQGNDAAALSGQIGQIEGNYLSEMGPLLQADAAAASTRDQARQQQIARDTANQILGLQGQKGAKQGDLAMQMQQYNNQLLAQQLQNRIGIQQYNNQYLSDAAQRRLGIMQYNQQGAQQGYENILSGLSTAAGIGLTGAQTKYYNTAGQPPKTFVPWAKITFPDKTRMVDKAGVTVAPQGWLVGWNPQDPPAKRQQAINNARTTMINWFRHNGYTNPQIAGMVDSAIRGYVNAARDKATQAGIKIAT